LLFLKGKDILEFVTGVESRVRVGIEEQFIQQAVILQFLLEIHLFAGQI